MGKIDKLPNSGPRFFKKLMKNDMQLDIVAIEKMKYAVVHSQTKDAIMNIYKSYGSSNWMEDMAIIGS